MGKLTLETFVQSLREDLGSNLVSVILYGSSVAGDHLGALSDTNLLVVTRRLESGDLDRAQGAVGRWVKSGQPSPVFFTREELRGSADVFPIEYADLAEARKVLYGEDPLKGLALSRANLRHELEHEFRGKLLQLREGYLLAGDDRKRVGDLMLRSVSTFLVLMRALVRLYGVKPPLKKIEALTILRARFSFNEKVFRVLDRARAEGAFEGDPRDYFPGYLSALEEVARQIDGLGVKPGRTKATRRKP